MSKLDDKIIFRPTKFDYVNPVAQVVIVGITPGNSQLEGTREGMTPREIKRTYAFAGNMRPNLIRMLDHIGINKLLSIDSCKSLWEDDFDKVEMTSLLKEATYIKKRDGSEDMFKDASTIAKSKKLTDMLKNGFAKDCINYTRAQLFVACGPKVYDVLLSLKQQGIISAPIIGIAHPSVGNNGRVYCYLGLKEPKDKTYVWCQEKAEEATKIIMSLL